MSDQKNNPGYVDQELLQILAKKIEPIKNRSFELLEIQPGDSILDAGCGPGLDTTTLARHFGGDVRITGIDYDPEMIAAANKRAQEQGVAQQIEHRVGDITALAFEDESFDAVRCDRALQHIAQSAQAISELVRVTKPGGRLVLLDPDWTTFSIDFPEPDLEWRLRRVATDRFANGYGARQSWRLLRQNGVKDLQAEPVSFVFSYPETRFLLLMDRVEQAALETGFITQEELAHWHTINEKADREGTFFSTVTAVLVAGTK
jgi:SAM-dependent methyltransferase